MTSIRPPRCLAALSLAGGLACGLASVLALSFQKLLAIITVILFRGVLFGCAFVFQSATMSFGFLSNFVTTFFVIGTVLATATRYRSRHWPRLLELGERSVSKDRCSNMLSTLAERSVNFECLSGCFE